MERLTALSIRRTSAIMVSTKAAGDDDDVKKEKNEELEKAVDDTL